MATTLVLEPAHTPTVQSQSQYPSLRGGGSTSLSFPPPSSSSAAHVYLCTRRMLQSSATSSVPLPASILRQVRSTVEAYIRSLGSSQKVRRDDGVEEVMDWNSLLGMIDLQLEEMRRGSPQKIASSSSAAPTVPSAICNNDGSTIQIATSSSTATRRRKQNRGTDKGVSDYESINHGNTTSTEKLQTLLLQQRDMTAQEIDAERSKHRALTQELAELTSVLMDATMSMQTTVSQQNIKLDAIQQHATDNKDNLQEQKKKMDDRQKQMTGTVFSTIGTLIWVVTLFILTYIVIRIFPKP